MLNRPLLKTVAKQRMAATGFKIYLYTIFLMITTSLPGYIIQLKMPVTAAISAGSLSELLEQYSGLTSDLQIPLLASVVLLVYNLFTTIIQVGYNRVCLMVAREEKVTFRDIFEGFGFWLKIILLSLAIGVTVFLGTLCFIIPGIILSFAYSQATFVLIDNPDMGVIAIMRRSRQLMREHKLEFFVFGLSYILWHFLAAFIGVASIFVTPYICVGEALFYEYICGYQRFSFKNEPTPPSDVTE